MANETKIKKVNKLKEELEKYDNFILTNYRGLNVEQISDLRKKLKEKEVGYHVVKNRFAKRVFNKLKIKDLDNILVDPTAIAYFNTDISDVVKILVGSMKATTLKIKGGFSQGHLLSKEDIELISKLPSRDVLIAQTIGLLNAPISGIVFVLNGIILKFVRTLKAIEEVKAEQHING